MKKIFNLKSINKLSRLDKKLFKVKFSCSHFCTSNFTKYIFIKPDSQLKNLKHKEEIFEFFSYNYLDLENDEIDYIIDQLENTHIQEPEIKFLKFFFRDLLEIKDFFEDENLIVKIFKFFIKKYKEISLYYDEPPDTIIWDQYFVSIFSGMYQLIISHSKFFKSNHNLFTLMNFLNEFALLDEKDSDILWNILLDLYFKNSQLYLCEELDMQKKTEILEFLLRNILENRIVDFNLTVLFINFYLASFQVADTAELILQKENVESIFIITEELKNKENIQNLKQINQINEIARKILENMNVDLVKLIKLEKDKREEIELKKKVEEEIEVKSYESLIKDFEKLRSKYIQS